MDTSLTIKPRNLPSRGTNVRPSVARTEVAPAQSVTPAPLTDPNHHPSTAQDSVGRDLVDPQGRDVIYRARDERERNRKRRHPDDALMRQHAYGRSTAPQGDDNADAHADFEI